MTIKTDILIIGGGIAGCTAAISLANSYNVILIDKLSEPVDRIGESLAPAARRILKQLGLLEELERIIKNKAVHLKNIGMQSYWGSKQVYIVDHLRNPDGFGWHLNRRMFEEYLRTKAIERGVKCIWGEQLHKSYYEKKRWHITTKVQNSKLLGTAIIAKFVIDASGRQAHFARNQGVKRESVDKLIACWATLPNKEENRMGTISASEKGWWYSAPLPTNKRVIAFQTDSDLVDRMTIKTLDSFMKLSKENQEITKIIENNKDPIFFQGIVAANSTRLDNVIGQQWAALGDAAMSFDPLSSQGMFNAMANAVQLTNLILKLNFIESLDTSRIHLFEKMYIEQISQIWVHYLKHKNIFYRAEMRWKESPFWKRRHC